MKRLAGGLGFEGVRGVGKIKSRERILTDKELKKIWSVLSDDTFSTIIRLCILTGQRRGEIEHIQVEGNIATIDGSHTKNGRTHTFPIGDFTLQYFKPNLSFNGWSKSKARLDTLSGVTNWTVHDLRRTYASTHARLGAPIHIIERLLNHVSGTLSGVAGTYNRYSYQKEIREAVDNYEKHIKTVLV